MSAYLVVQCASMTDTGSQCTVAEPHSPRRATPRASYDGQTTTVTPGQSPPAAMKMATSFLRGQLTGWPLFEGFSGEYNATAYEGMRDKDPNDPILCPPRTRFD